DIDYEATAAAVRQSDPKRHPDLRAGAERTAGVAIGPVEIPELENPILQRARGKHPVFVLDDLPNFVRQSRQRDWAYVPVLPRLLLPLGEQGVVTMSDLCGATGDAIGEGGVATDPVLAKPRQLRDCRDGVTEHPQTAVGHAGEIHRPFGKPDIPEA